MPEWIASLAELAGGGMQLLVLLGVFLGVVTIVVGIGITLAPDDPVTRRLAAAGPASVPLPVNIRAGTGSRDEESGIGRVIAPTDEKERYRDPGTPDPSRLSQSLTRCFTIT